MEKVYVIYWTQTGNTQLMAQHVADGIKAAGKTVELLEVGAASAELLKDQSSFALGCPAMGDEVLEESEMEPFVSEIEDFAKGKKIGLFGSYGWGDGQWMRDWESRMQKAGAEIVNGEGVICQADPDADTAAALESLGKALAE